MCLLWGAEDTAGETPGSAIPGCRKHPSLLFQRRFFAELLSQGEPAAVPLQPQRALPGEEETFFCPQKRTRQGQVPGSAPCNGRRHRGASGKDGGWEGERERTEREKGAGGRPRRPYPAPGRQLQPAGDVRIDAGRTDAGRIPHRRATGPRARQPRLRPGGRGLQGEARGRPAGRSGCGGGKERLSPRGITKRSLPSGACAWGGVCVSQPVRHRHPASHRSYTSAVTAPRPSGSLIPAATPTQSPQQRQQARQCLHPGQRDARTDSHVGTARPFQRVLTSPTLFPPPRLLRAPEIPLSFTTSQ